MGKEAESTDHSRIPETGLISEGAVSAGNKDGVGGLWSTFLRTLSTLTLSTQKSVLPFPSEPHVGCERLCSYFASVALRSLT